MSSNRKQNLDSMEALLQMDAEITSGYEHYDLAAMDRFVEVLQHKGDAS